MKLDQFKDIYRLVFKDPAPWCEWFFSRIDEDDIFIIKDGCGRAAATLLMEDYAFRYSSAELRSGYVSCVATRPECRSRGFASELMRQSLQEAKRRGYAFCELIPADEHLFFFYRRFGYAKVFYVDRERYTSLHPFPKGDTRVVEPSYDAFRALEDTVGAGPVHSLSQFEAVMRDNAFESGHEVIFMEDETLARACLFATYDKKAADSPVSVRCLLADTSMMADSVLAELRKRVGERALTVHRPPVSGLKEFLEPFGMLRIIDPGAVLSAMAATHNTVRTSIRVHDPEIADNNGAFVIEKGTCTRVDDVRNPDLDVDIEILALLLFCNEKTGKIFGLPTRRPYMSLMLD